MLQSVSLRLSSRIYILSVMKSSNKVPQRLVSPEEIKTTESRASEIEGYDNKVRVYFDSWQR